MLGLLRIGRSSFPLQEAEEALAPRRWRCHQHRNLILLSYLNLEQINKEFGNDWTAILEEKRKRGRTVQGDCIHGSPSTCIGKRFRVRMTMLEHCASRLPEARSPVFTCPMWRQFSNPITSINPSPISVDKIGRNRELAHKAKARRYPSTVEDWFTLQGHAEIDEIETATGQLPLLVVFLA